MIYNRTLLTAKCNNCGATFSEFTDFSLFEERDELEDALKDERWHIDGADHYCPNCYTLDDECEVVILPKLNPEDIENLNPKE